MNPSPDDVKFATEIDGMKYYINKDGLQYPYPAYYNLDTHGILDSSQGD